MSEEYQCKMCGDYFEYQRDYKSHKSTCGVESLKEFVSEETKGFFNLNKAIRLNDYNKNNSKSNQAVQKDLKNRPVGEKSKQTTLRR